jgi:hypothetical protein
MPEEIGPDIDVTPPTEGAPGASAVLAQLAFVRGAYGTAEGVIRLADEKFSYVLLFHGILVAILSLQVDGIIGMLASPRRPMAVRGLFLAGCLLFLGAAGASLGYAVKSRSLSVELPADVPRFLDHLSSLEAGRLIEGMARAHHQTSGIVQRKLALLRACFAWAAVAFAGWAAALLMILTF